MEVHPPEHPIHTWRDFLIHIATIVVGLLIAIALEQTVEWVHHKHLVREARETIRTELEQNHAAMKDNITYLGQNLDTIKSNIRTLDSLRAHTPPAQMSLTYHMSYSGMSDAAWHTAHETGALSYMPYEEVQHYSDIYASQEDANTQAAEIARHEFTILGPTQIGIEVAKLPDSDYDQMLRGSGMLLIEACAFRQQLEQVDQLYLTYFHQNPASTTVDSCSNLMQ